MITIFDKIIDIPIRIKKYLNNPKFLFIYLHYSDKELISSIDTKFILASTFWERYHEINIGVERKTAPYSNYLKKDFFKSTKLYVDVYITRIIIRDNDYYI